MRHCDRPYMYCDGVTQACGSPEMTCRRTYFLIGAERMLRVDGSCWKELHPSPCVAASYAHTSQGTRVIRPEPFVFVYHVCQLTVVVLLEGLLLVPGMRVITEDIRRGVMLMSQWDAFTAKA